MTDEYICTQNGHHYCKTTIPLQINAEEKTIRCFCLDCKKEVWVLLPQERFAEICNTSNGKEGIYIGRI
jgi:hypothetical protein